jgi:hypothetical protein
MLGDDTGGESNSMTSDQSWEKKKEKRRAKEKSWKK